MSGAVDMLIQLTRLRVQIPELLLIPHILRRVCRVGIGARPHEGVDVNVAHRHGE